MKGFFIQVTNNLLDPKHKKHMGTAVWEFMWMLDKITRVDEDGTGWVLGGKPINVKDIYSEIGGADRATRKNIDRLRSYGYIRTQRTPGGLRVWIAKAKKSFGNSDRHNSAARSAQYRRSNIRQYKDNKQRMKTSKTFSPYKKELPRSMEYIEIDEDGREQKARRSGPKPEGKNKIAMRLQRKFVQLCQKHLSTSPVMDIKGYKMCIFAMNSGGLTEPQIVDLFEEWFSLGKPDEETISVTRALSARQIEAYKIRNNVK